MRFSGLDNKELSELLDVFTMDLPEIVHHAKEILKRDPSLYSLEAFGRGVDMTPV